MQLSRIAALLAIAAAGFLAATPSLSAQIEIHPDGGTIEFEGLGPYVVPFTVLNSSSSENGVNIYCDYSGHVTGCSVDEFVYVPANDSATVLVTITGTPGSGTVTLNGLGIGGFDDGFSSVVLPLYSVLVTALPGPDTLITGEVGDFLFKVKNTGTMVDTFHMACIAPSQGSCTNVNPQTAVIQEGEEVLITYSAHGGVPGGTATSLSATGLSTDTATYSFVVDQPPRVALMSPYGDRILRAGCPTVGAGAGSAVQCGDLLYAHALPAYRSRNKARSLTFLYNSSTVNPRPVVALDYSLLAEDPELDTMRVEVWRDQGGTPVRIARVYYKPDTSAIGVIRTSRLVVPIAADSLGLGTGAYPIKIQVYRKPVGQAWLESSPDTFSARLLVVDRTTSPFGAGWWPAGVERLYPDSLGVLLVTGDGSAAYFTKQGSSYVAPPGEHSTLATTSGGGFLRTAPGGRTKIAYNSLGVVDSVYDNNPTPNVAHYFWTASQLDSIADATGKTITLVYSGSTVTVGVPTLASSLLTKNASTGNLTSITDPDGFVTSFTYETGTHRMASSKARGTDTYTYAYDPVGRVDSVVPPQLFANPTLTRHYTSWQRTGAPYGASTGDAAHPVPLENQPKPSFRMSWVRSSAGGATESAYFEVGRLGLPVFVAPPGGGNTTAITRDSVGQPTLVRTYTGAHVKQTWNSDGNLVRSVAWVPGNWQDRNASHYDTTTYTYHPTWKTVTKIVPPLKTADVNITYDSYGRRASIADALSHTTTFEYTSDGLLEKIHEPQASGIYGGLPDTITTVYGYDSSTRNLESVTRGDRGQTYVYSTNGSDVVQVDDAEGGSVSYDYDAIKRVTEVTRSGPEAVASTVGYDFNDSARTKTMTDPDGRETVWTSDAAGRLISECRPNNICIQYSYGDGMNVTAITKPNAGQGSVTNMEFDAAGRMTHRENRADTVDYAYDVTGGPTLITSEHSKIIYQYDALGRTTCERELIRSVNDSTPFFKGVTAWYDYDNMGRRSRMYYTNDRECEGDYEEEPSPFDPPDEYDPSTWREPDPMPEGASEWVVYADSSSISYTYDDAGSLKTIVNRMYWYPDTAFVTDQWSYTYDSKNRVRILNSPHLSNATSQYNQNGDLASYSVPGYWQATLDYDDLGRITSSDAGGQVSTYDYDGLGRMITETGSGGTVHHFAYDPAGNRTNDGQYDYAYGGDPGQHSWDVGRLLARTGNEMDIYYRYDARGNQIKAGSSALVNNNVLTNPGDKILEYDGDDHLVRQTGYISGTGNCAGTQFEERDFWYDGLGRRIFMRSSGPCSNDWGTYRYYWIDNQVIAKVQSNISNPGDTANEDILWPAVGKFGQWFLYGPGTDNVLASWTGASGGVGPQISAGSRMEFVHDHRGSVVNHVCIGSSGCAPANGAFSAFGSGGTAGQPGFNGAESTAGLVYMRNRWYDPNTGRFTQEDPIGYAGGVNLYAYAGGDPVTYSDPWGLCPGIPGTNPMDFSDCPPFYFTIVGSVVGFLVGGSSGAAGGAVLAAPTGELAAPVLVPAGAIVGGIKGAAVGAAAGSALDLLVAQAQAGRGGGNVAENRGSTYYARKYGLNKDGAEQLKRALEEAKRSGEKVTDDFLEEEARAISDIPKYVNPK